MTDALSELKKYKKINYEKIYSEDAPAYLRFDNKYGMAEYLDRMAKSLFKLEQRYEGISDELTEISDETKNIEELYKNLLSDKESSIKDLQQDLTEERTKIGALLDILDKLSDKLDLVEDFIRASGNKDWIGQMDMISASLRAVMAENGIVRTGNEKYFNEAIHEAVSAVKLEEKDFGEIVGVECKGCIYSGKVIKKAKVVVNNYRKAESNVENSRD